MPFAQVLPSPPSNGKVHGRVSYEALPSQSRGLSALKKYITICEEDDEAQQANLPQSPPLAGLDGGDAERWRPASSSSRTSQETDMDLRVQRRGCCRSAFVRESTGGEVDKAMEQKFARDKYHRCRTAFIKVAFFMPCGVLCLVVSALTQGLWVRSAILLLGVAPGYLFMGLGARRRKQEFLNASGTYLEKMLIGLLCLQSVLIVLAECFRPDLDYGLLVMHIGFVHNFTPLSEGAMQVITVGFSLLPYSLAMLQFIDPYWKFANISADCIIGGEANLLEQVRERIALPIIILIYQVIVTMRREDLLRFDTLHGARLQRQQRVLTDERNRIEGLLGSMLPFKIIRALQADEPIEPQLFNDVTVVFVEICDFHHCFHYLEPEDVLEVLNIIYYEFDRLSDNLPSVFKVETVMQVYMAVVGCPEPTKCHADLAAQFAIAAQGSMEDLRKRAKHCMRATSQAITDELAISIRVGLHSGPVRAGTVGMDSPRYRLIGDTVSTASRMEITCEPGRIQVSSSTLERLTPGMFLLEDRGEIPVKGKGTMRTAYLIGYNQGSPSYDNSMEIERQRRQIIHSKAIASTVPASSNSLDTDVPADGLESEDEFSRGPQWANNETSCLSLQAWAGRRSQRTTGSAPSWWERFHLMFLFVPESQKNRMKMVELQRERAEFLKKRLPQHLNQARKLTTLLLLVMSAVSTTDCFLDSMEEDPIGFWKVLGFRAIGNYSVGLVYLIFFSCSGMTRRLAQVLTVLMLLIEGSTFLGCNVYLHNSKAPLIEFVAIFGAYALFYKVCTLLHRLAICASACGGFLFIRIAECNFTFYSETINNVCFLAIFVSFLACGVRQQEHLELVSHYEQGRATKRVQMIKNHKAVSYHVLSSMLPPHVVSLVLNGRSPIVENHSDVTIIFTSIKGFTAYSSKVTPQQLFTMLNSMFSTFDEIIANWGLHKVEIISDGYCISAGCPRVRINPDSYEYALRAVELGLAMQRTLPSVVDATAVQMRVGIHTGSVVAGVVGKKGPRYHLFGPAVSYAKKMESCGVPGRVQISDATHQMLVRDGHSYDFEEHQIYLEDQQQSQRVWLVNRSVREAFQIQRKLMSQRRGK